MARTTATPLGSCSDAPTVVSPAAATVPVGPGRTPSPLVAGNSAATRGLTSTGRATPAALGAATAAPGCTPASRALAGSACTGPAGRPTTGMVGWPGPSTAFRCVGVAGTISSIVAGACGGSGLPLAALRAPGAATATRGSTSCGLLGLVAVRRGCGRGGRRVGTATAS